jgi:DNA modification methylase
MAKLKPIRNRVKELRNVRASELLDSPQNWRKHPKIQKNALQEILEEVGYAGALIARELPDKQLILIDGHLRKEVTPDEIVPVLILDVNELEAKKLLATYDPISALAEMDIEKWNILKQEIKFETQALKSLIDNTKDPNPEPHIELAGELQKKYNTQLGQVWTFLGKSGTHRIMCGDALKNEDVQKLTNGRQVDMLLTDPPYNIDYHGKLGTIGTYESLSASKKSIDKQSFPNDKMSKEDYRAFIAKSFTLAKEQLKPGGAFYCWHSDQTALEIRKGFEDAELQIRQGLVWNKSRFTLGTQDHQQQHEPCLYGWVDADSDYVESHDKSLYGWKDGKAHIWLGNRKTGTVFEIDKPTASYEHPTMKPMELFAISFNNSCPLGGIAYDPFLGSGTTLIAAEYTGRLCYGMELLPKYIAVVIQRATDAGLTPILE